MRHAEVPARLSAVLRRRHRRASTCRRSKRLELGGPCSMRTRPCHRRRSVRRRKLFRFSRSENAEPATRFVAGQADKKITRRLVIVGRGTRPCATPGDLLANRAFRQAHARNTSGLGRLGLGELSLTESQQPHGRFLGMALISKPCPQLQGGSQERPHPFPRHATGARFQDSVRGLNFEFWPRGGALADVATMYAWPKIEFGNADLTVGGNIGNATIGTPGGHSAPSAAPER